MGLLVLANLNVCLWIVLFVIDENVTYLPYVAMPIEYASGLRVDGILEHSMRAVPHSPFRLAKN